MSDDRNIFSRKAMELVDEILGYEVEIDRLADENAVLKELNQEIVGMLKLLHLHAHVADDNQEVKFIEFHISRNIWIKVEELLAKAEGKLYDG